MLLGMTTTLAGRFFGERELNAELGIDSAKTLWQRLAHEILIVASMSSSPDKFPMYYRGQQNADWGMASSLFRLCSEARTPRAVTEDVMLAAESATLAAAREANLGRWMTDAQLLMVLQHHRHATRLLDVSDGILEALYFAVDDDAVDGRLFILRPSLIAESVTDPPREDVLPVGPVSQLPWLDHAGAAVGSVPIWDERIAITERPRLDVRMFAQRGRLLVGGMPQPAPGRIMHVATSDIPPEDWAAITTLVFDFPMPGEMPHDAWSGGAWTIRIDGSWKPEIRDLLAGWTYPIAHSSMFPAVDTATGSAGADAAARLAAKAVP